MPTPSAEELNAIRIRVVEKMAALSSSIKQDVRAGGRASEQTRVLLDECQRVDEEIKRIVNDLQAEAGISDELLAAVEQAQLPPLEDRYWREQMVDVPPTGWLDAILPGALDKLLRLTDSAWLKEQGGKTYRLDHSFLTSPVRLLGPQRIESHGGGGPQRFAKMLLTCLDHLERRDSLDFFAAPMLIAEVAALGSRLDMVGSLGTEAMIKLRNLPKLPDAEVASTIYELLVGTACIQRGLAGNRNVETNPTKCGQKNS